MALMAILAQINLLDLQASQAYYTYERWLQSKDKGHRRFYASEEFRELYTTHELRKKQNLVHSLIKTQLQGAIMATGIFDYKILSLGCGPGSDLLSVAQVFQSVCVPDIQVKLTGVDLYDWPLDEFAERLDDIETQGPVENFRHQFYFNLDMKAYVRYALSRRKSFDFIVLSFAEVKNSVSFVGRQLPQLLRDGGRIFVVDNLSQSLNELCRNYGFKRIGQAGTTVCLMFDDEADTSSESEESDEYSYY